MYQFLIKEILVQPYAQAAGPYNFDLSPQLPEGDNVAACDVEASLDGSDTTADLIASKSLSENEVSIYFNYPGAEKHGRHKLRFKYTLQSGAKDEADFGYVVVKDE